MSEYEIENWAFDNASLVARKSGLEGELISIKLDNGEYTVVTIHDGVTQVAHIGQDTVKEWIK